MSKASSYTNSPYRIVVTDLNGLLENLEHRIVPGDGGADVLLTLPLNPIVGNRVKVSVFNKINVNVITNDANLIMGINDSLLIDLPYASMEFVYVGSTIGWRIN